MPPTSVNIFEEGAEIVSFKIVDAGFFNRDGLIEYMVDKPSQYPEVLDAATFAMSRAISKL